MTKYKLEKKLTKSSCELCSPKIKTKKAVITSVNEYHKDGTIKIHHTCSNHIIDLYNKIIKET